MLNKRTKLTERELTKLKQGWDISVTMVGKIVNQPSIPGASTRTLSSLFSLNNFDFNQTPVSSTKVKSILFKPDTGLVNNDFWLFNPIVLASSEGNEDSVCLVSGRTRLQALVTICDVVGIDPSTVDIEVVEYQYDTEERMAMSIVAFNTNRTMPASERERIVMSANLGDAPTQFNAKGIRTKADCKRHFKQVCLGEFIEVQETEEDDASLFLTQNNLYRVFGYLFDIIFDNYPETYKSLKSGDNDSWECINWMIGNAYSNNVFLKENCEGNSSRNKEFLISVAYEIIKLWESVSNETDNTSEDETKTSAF